MNTVKASGNKVLKDLIKFANSLGFAATSTKNGHIKFVKEGCKPVFTSSTFSCAHGAKNAMSDIKRSNTFGSV